MTLLLSLLTPVRISWFSIILLILGILLLIFPMSGDMDFLKDSSVSFRCSKMDKMFLEEAALFVGCSVSELVRRSAFHVALIILDSTVERGEEYYDPSP